mmetsp:Transcript_22540/g.49143  ORF Transcript_22540/g.49143 Transcript_22540/m.49143 type:complete len:115 (-) Transcript_22540:172-516(-)
MRDEYSRSDIFACGLWFEVLMDEDYEKKKPLIVWSLRNLVPTRCESDGRYTTDHNLCFACRVPNDDMLFVEQIHPSRTRSITVFDVGWFMVDSFQWIRSSVNTCCCTKPWQEWN